jgi:tetratricopeptide (TPR) repeat protein
MVSPHCAQSRRSFLGQRFRLTFAFILAVLLAVPDGVAQSHPQVSLETSETIFAVLTAINTCGYDQELNSSNPIRSQIRLEVAKAVENTSGAKEAVAPMCAFYRQHQQPEPARDLSQYISLALYLNEPPTFTTKAKESELPPDAVALIDFVPLMQAFYEKIGLHAIWERHQEQYTQFTEIYHAPLSKMTFDTEIYLKLPSAGYLGRQFTVYLDAMGAPGQTNARNYASDYYIVFAPTSGTALKMQQIHHTYLHYILDPLALKNSGSFKRLEPLLEQLKPAPMDEAFRTNISLLVTECFVRAIELRTGSPKLTDAEVTQNLDQDDKEGFVLTRYFYNALGAFEKEPTGLRTAYGGILAGIEVDKEKKRVAEIRFAGEAEPELLHLARSQTASLLLNAERRLSAGDPESAQKLAQQALDEKKEDPGRALFILAQVATANSDMVGARTYFQRAIESAHEPKVIAWSHVYLGRIFDLKQDRYAAVEQYHEAVNAAGSAVPEAKVAAEKGLEQPYEPPIQRRPE